MQSIRTKLNLISHKLSVTENCPIQKDLLASIWSLELQQWIGPPKITKIWRRQSLNMSHWKFLLRKWTLFPWISTPNSKMILGAKFTSKVSPLLLCTSRMSRESGCDKSYVPWNILFALRTLFIWPPATFRIGENFFSIILSFNRRTQQLYWTVCLQKGLTICHFMSKWVAMKTCDE